MISALIPVFNGERTIRKALDSVLAQSNLPDEIIVLNDGSTDGTAEAVREYPQVKLLSRENRGIGATRKRLVEEAEGDWLAFLDADDYWQPEKLERQSALCNDSTLGLIHTRDVFFYASGGATHGSWSPPKEATALDHVLPDCRINMSSVLARREAILQAGNFENTSRAEDWLMWLRLAANWEFAFVPEPLTWTLRAAGSASAPNASWYAGEREVLCTHILPVFDELYTRYSESQRAHYRRLVNQKLGAISSLHAEALDQEGRHREALELHIDALRRSPTRKGAWLRLGKHLTGAARSGSSHKV